MNLEQFAFPFSVGMLAAFNPCGFAMLPTWIGYFIGAETPDETRVRAITRGMWVGAVLTGGFVAVFGGLGILIAAFVSQGAIVEYVGYITIALGVLLLPLGIAMYRGRQVSLRLPKFSRGGASRGSGSIFLFGVSYAVVSLSCTIGLFVSSVSNTFTTDGYWAGFGSFIAYALGMGSVILFLTVSLARAKSNVATRMRQFLPHMGTLSGIVLVVAGVYLIDYGVWELRVFDDPSAGNLLVDHFLRFQGAVSTWTNDTTPERLGVVALLAIALLLLVAWIEDNPGDPVRRTLMVGSWLLVFCTIEFVNDGDFVCAPTVRFIANWPARIANWVRDPWRGGVPLEMVFVAVSARWAWARGSRYRRADASIAA